MTMLVDNFRIPAGKDKRKKLSDVEKGLIKEDYLSGASIHSMAKKYGVSRRLIQFILFPERLTENLKRREERGGSKVYYNKQVNTQAQRRHRQYKRELMLEDANVSRV